MTKTTPRSYLKRIAGYLSLGLVLSFATFIAIPAEQAGAAVWDNRCYSRSRSCGYFYGGYWTAAGCGAYLICGGIYGINSVSQFVATMRAHNRGADPQNKMGAAFIAHSMLGRNGDQANAAGGINVSDGDFAILEQRLNGLSSINWNATVCSDGIDTMAVRSGTRRDTLRNPIPINRCEAGILFIDGSGHQYKLFKRCANPVGAMDVLDSLNYSLDPVMNTTPDTGEGGSTATLAPTVTNTGSSNSPGNIEWQITNFTVPPAGTVPGGNGNSGQAPVDYYGNGATVIQAGSSTFNRGANAINANPHTMGDVPVGTRVCYALSVRPFSQSTGANWRHSPPDCVTIAKKPKLQVLGNDLLVGKGQTSNIVTSSTTKTVGGTTRTYGSWSEYAIAASGRVTSMGSGAAYSGGATSNLFCALSLLTFSNTTAGQTSCTASTQMGSYANTKALPDIGARLRATSSLGNNPSVNVASVATGSYNATGNVTVTSSGPIAKGKWVVINAPTATVTITSNINYTTDVLRSLTDIPQVVIIANEIRIAGGVTNVDAWLVANGTNGNLVTCSDVTAADQLNATRCNQKLTVNGPVMARHLYLYRTAGAGTGAQTGDPAEVFNLRPDAYLWATGYSSEAGRLQTVTTKELPPRF